MPKFLKIGQPAGVDILVYTEQDFLAPRSSLVSPKFTQIVEPAVNSTLAEVDRCVKADIHWEGGFGNTSTTASFCISQACALFTTSYTNKTQAYTTLKEGIGSLRVSALIELQVTTDQYGH